MGWITAELGLITGRGQNTGLHTVQTALGPIPTHIH